MGLRILHSADWHLHTAFGSCSEPQRTLLRAAQKRIPDMITGLCGKYHCDLVLLAGDLFDGRPDRQSIALLRKALEQCRVPVFIAPGNHDFCTLGSPWLEEIWPENVHIFKRGMEAVSLPELNCRVYGAGYQSMDCPPLLEGFHAAGTERYQLAVLHGDPLTTNSPYCPVTAAQIRQSGLDYLALGHIHKAGSLQIGKTLCLWPGCPMGRGWDETGEKGIWITTLGENPAAEFISLDLPRFYELTAESADLEQLLPAEGGMDFYRIILTGEAEEDLTQLQKKYSRFPNLVLLDRTTPKTELWADVDQDSFRGVYFRLLQQQAEENPRSVMAAELSHRILSGREVLLP